MTNYSHAVGGQRNEGLIDMLSDVVDDETSILTEDASKGTEVDDEGFQNFLRQSPADALFNSNELGAVDGIDGGTETRLEDLRTSDEGRLVQAKVQVDFVSEVYATPETIHFRCNVCHERTEVQQDTKNNWRQTPDACANKDCNSNNFTADEKDLVDKQIAKVSDLPDGEGTPATTMLHIYDTHLGEIHAGDTIIVSGVVQHVPVSAKQNETKEERELVVTHLVNQDAPDVEVTEDDREQFESLDEPVEALVESLAPHLVGLDTEKRGLLHLVASGHDEIGVRTNSHGLLIGDPSAGKSALLEALNKVVPKSIIASSESASGVGMTATVEQEERLGGKWVCRAGALVKANGGHAFVDELDEFREDDLAKLLTALQSEEVRVNKASINQTLPASTRFIGAANPENGEFDPFEPYADQFDFPPALLARMDLVYVFTDEGEDDEAVADAIMGQFTTDDEADDSVPLTPDELRKYLHYVLSEYNPTISREAREYASQVWQDLRDQTDGAIDKRDAKSILRLAIASARLNRRSEVTLEDVEIAQELKVESLQQVGHGEIDAQVKYSGELTEQSSVKKAVLSTVEGADGLSDDELLELLDGYPEETVEHYVEKHLNAGNITRRDGGVLTAS